MNALCQRRGLAGSALFMLVSLLIAHGAVLAAGMGEGSDLEIGGPVPAVENLEPSRTSSSITTMCCGSSAQPAPTAPTILCWFRNLIPKPASSSTKYQ